MKEQTDSLLYLSSLQGVFKDALNLPELGTNLEPVKFYLQDVNEFETMSLVRHITKNKELAFFFQFFLESYKLLSNNALLTQINRDYLIKKINPDLKGLTSLSDILTEDIQNRMIPSQKSFLLFSIRESIDFLTRKYPQTNRYLNNNSLLKVQASISFCDSFVYNNTSNLTNKLDSLSSGIANLKIGLPLLTSFAYKFSLPMSAISHQGVKWTVLEEICKSISTLEALKSEDDIIKFIHQMDLSEGEIYKYLQLSPEKQLEDAQEFNQNFEKLSSIKQRFYTKTKQKISNLIFPEEDLTLIKTLLEWANEE